MHYEFCVLISFFSCVFYCKLVCVFKQNVKQLWSLLVEIVSLERIITSWQMKKEKEQEESKTKLYKWDFYISGPTHLTSVDWTKQDHTRSVLASLIQGVYILERDRQQKRTEDKALAPSWWDFFHFQPIKTLIDPFDSSIFGSIFEHKFHTHTHTPNHDHQCLPPRYVIAFRGTILEPETRKRDLYLDIQIPLNGLTHDPRYHISYQEVQSILNQTSPKNVVLTGHSLGAAIALQVGKDMAKKGSHIRTYLFNPPYTCAPIERINNPYLKSKIRVAKSMVTAGVYKVVKKNYTLTRELDPFYSLCSWVPNLFVNPNDPFGCEYIGYFEHRGRMKEMGKDKTEDIAIKNSLMSMLAGAFGRDYEAPHLIPSAFVVKNMVSLGQSIKEAHSVDQWWKPHPHWQSKLYLWENVIVNNYV